VERSRSNRIAVAWGNKFFDDGLTMTARDGFLIPDYATEFRAMFAVLFFECPTDFSSGSVQAGTGNPT